MELLVIVFFQLTIIHTPTFSPPPSLPLQENGADPGTVDTPPCAGTPATAAAMYVALYNWVKADSTQLSFKKGDKVRRGRVGWLEEGGDCSKLYALLAWLIVPEASILITFLEGNSVPLPLKA